MAIINRLCNRCIGSYAIKSETNYDCCTLNYGREGNDEAQGEWLEQVTAGGKVT